MSEAATWFLEYVDDESREMRRVSIAHVPFRIGRAAGHDLVLTSPEISADHAEIASNGSQLVLRDLGSRNGTFLADGSQLAAGDEKPIVAGDRFEIGPLKFRLSHTAEQRSVEESGTARPRSDVSQAFDDLLENEAVEPLFQPIVDLKTGETVALEALGRGRSPDLPQNPVELFRIAEASGEARQLARIFRQTALAAAHWARIRIPIFFNVHASELMATDFFDEIAAIRDRHPKLSLVLEVSEQFSTPLPRLRALRAFLNQQDMKLSYDDFGAGLARIQELAEAPSDFLKFDALPIRGLRQAAEPEKRRVSALIGAAKGLGMRLLAEGLETGPEAEACIQIGFELGQGFLFGQPAPLTSPAKR